MSKLRIIIGVIIVNALVLTSIIEAQPKSILNLNLELAKPVGTLSLWRPGIGFTPLDQSYGLNFAVGFSGYFKYAINQSRSTRLVGGLLINRFLNHSFSKFITGIQDNTDLYVLSLSLGLEYAINPGNKISPFAGFDATVNSLSGGLSWQPLVTGISDISIKPAWRFGVQAGAGLNLSFWKKYNLILGVKYHLANLIGKTSDTTSFGHHEVNLNDDAYTYNGINYGTTDIGYFRFYAGVAINFGNRKTKEQENTIETDIPTDDPDKAFNIAKRKFDKGDYVSAIEDFSTIKILYPGTDVIEKARFYTAESYFYQNEYLLAEYEYSSYLHDYPSMSKFYPEAMYKLGLTYYNLSPKYSLDQEFTKLAIKRFLEFISMFPDNIHVAEADSKIKELRNKLAYKDYVIAENYMKISNYRSAAIYFQSVYDNYIESEWADDAILGHTEALINGKKFVDAKKVLDKFYQYFPKSGLKPKADNLLTRIKENQPK